MRFVPFHLKDYPFIDKDLSSIIESQSVARLGKNAIRLPERVFFTITDENGARTVEVPLGEEAYLKADLSLTEKTCFKRIASLLEKADEADLKIALANYGSLYGVSQAIKLLDQNFGGKRFVDLARDIIDSHMDVCLYPYMAHDLSITLFFSYNKNINRDVDGFMDSYLGFLRDFVKDNANLRQIFLQIEEKSSENIYLSLVKHALDEPDLLYDLSLSITDLFSDENGFRVNYASSIPGEWIARFPKPVLTLFFETASYAFDHKVIEVFDCLGTDCDGEFLGAYQRNPYYDPAILLKCKAIQGMDPAILEEMRLREWILGQSEGKELILAFEKLTNTDEQNRFLKFCIDAGWDDLSKALKGEAFSIRRLDFDSVYHLLPYINFDIEKNRLQVLSFLRDCVDYNPTAAERLLLGLHHPSFADFVRGVLKKQKIRDFKTQVILADRFHCPEAIQLKEWH